jgi:DNA-binding LytR/AlgR family response regulator
MKKPAILILDDEILAASYLEELIESVQLKNSFFSNFECITSNTLNDFFDKLKSNLPEIIFLDIEMPKKNGLEIAKEIRENYEIYGYKDFQFPIIIFSTAFDNYGYQAFSVDAFDYILKPIDLDKLSYVFSKIEAQFSNHLKQFSDYIKVPHSGIEIDLPIKDVLYFKSDMKYTTVVTEKKEYLISKTLLSLEEKYSNFIKIHRAYLVNPLFIQKFYKKDNHWFLSLRNHDNHLPVSRRQKLEIEKKINQIGLID